MKKNNDFLWFVFFNHKTNFPTITIFKKWIKRHTIWELNKSSDSKLRKLWYHKSWLTFDVALCRSVLLILTFRWRMVSLHCRTVQIRSCWPLFILDIREIVTYEEFSPPKFFFQLRVCRCYWQSESLCI